MFEDEASIPKFCQDCGKHIPEVRDRFKVWLKDGDQFKAKVLCLLCFTKEKSDA